MDDVISRRAAIKTINKIRDVCDTESLDDYRDLLVECFEVMPSAQPEQTDCEYCHEDSDGYVKPIEKNCHAFIRFGMNGWEISLSAKGWNGSAKIMYCPMCGRRLTDG